MFQAWCARGDGWEGAFLYSGAGMWVAPVGMLNWVHLLVFAVSRAGGTSEKVLFFEFLL